MMFLLLFFSTVSLVVLSVRYGTCTFLKNNRWASNVFLIFSCLANKSINFLDSQMGIISVKPSIGPFCISSRVFLLVTGGTECFIKKNHWKYKTSFSTFAIDCKNLFLNWKIQLYIVFHPKPGSSLERTIHPVYIEYHMKNHIPYHRFPDDF